MDRLSDANGRGIKILVIYGKDQLKPGEKDQLLKLKNLSLLFCENLHAKCYFNEDNMVITSMNMYEFSEKNNREMGLLINRASDSEAFSNAVKEIQSIQQASVATEGVVAQQNKVKVFDSPKNPVYRVEVPIEIPKKPTFDILDKIGHALGLSEESGYCIRGGEKIPFDPARPFCLEHYKSWEKYGDKEYMEKYCHLCGKHHRTTFNKPLCISCFKNS